VSYEQSSLAEANHPSPVHHGWFYRRTVLPILALLRIGATPEQLAWSIAVGLFIGINPLLGSTTVACLAIAGLFRLNVAASQIANHVVYPLQLLLFIPFLRLGTRLFGTAPLPLKPAQIMDAAKHHPLDLIRELWRWEWHALAVWAIVAAVMIPLVALAATPLFRHLLKRVKGRQYPIVPAH